MMSIELETETETQPIATLAPQLYWVAVYDVNQRYGGPEEGGWWYTVGSLVLDPRVYKTIGLTPRAFTNEGDAATYCRDINELIRRRNLAPGLHPDLSSVICDGAWQAEVHEGFLPQGYPDRKPHYE